MSTTHKTTVPKSVIDAIENLVNHYGTNFDAVRHLRDWAKDVTVATSQTQHEPRTVHLSDLSDWKNGPWWVREVAIGAKPRQVIGFWEHGIIVADIDRLTYEYLKADWKRTNADPCDPATVWEPCKKEVEG